MLKRTLTALLICAMLTAVPLNLTRTSQTRIRAELLGMTAVLELDTIAMGFEIITQGLEPWMSSLPSFVYETAENIASSVLAYIDSRIPEAGKPSCSFC